MRPQLILLLFLALTFSACKSGQPFQECKFVEFDSVMEGEGEYETLYFSESESMIRPINQRGVYSQVNCKFNLIETANESKANSKSNSEALPVQLIFDVNQNLPREERPLYTSWLKDVYVRIIPVSASNAPLSARIEQALSKLKPESPLTKLKSTRDGTRYYCSMKLKANEVIWNSDVQFPKLEKAADFLVLVLVRQEQQVYSRHAFFRRIVKNRES